MANTYRAIFINPISGSDDKTVRVSADDLVSGFLEDKTIAGSTKVVLSVDNPGGIELLNIDIDQTQIDHDQLLNFELKFTAAKIAFKCIEIEID